jgi:DNA-binding MarR family transcriptional regulator
MAYSKGGQAFTDLVLLVFQLNGALLEAGENLTRPVGQTSARWQVMGCVDEQPLSVADVARTMGLTRQSVQRTADLLVRDGLAVYTDNPNHKRAKLLKLNAKGLKALRQIEAAQLDWANRIGASSSLAELERSSATLQALLGTLRTDPNAEKRRP